MNTKSIMHVGRPFFTAFLGFFSLLIFADYSFLPSFFLSAFLFSTSLMGMFVFRLISNRNDLNQFELVGVGIACGTLIPAFLGYFLKSFLNIPSAFGFLIFAIVAVLGFRNKHLELASDSNNYQIWFDAALLFGTASAVAQFVRIYYFVGVITLFFVFAIWRFTVKLPSSNYVTTTRASILLSSLILFSSRFIPNNGQTPVWQQILYVDQIFDTAQSWSIAKFGNTDNVFAFGNAMPGHTLTHAWAGITQDLLHTPTFMTSGLGGIILGALGSSALIMGVSFRLNRKLASVLGAIFIWVYQSSFVDQFYASPNPRISNSISLFWFTFALFLILELRNSSLKYPIFVVPLILSAIGLGKLHWSVYLISTSGVIAFLEFIKNPRSKRTQKFLFLIFLGLILIGLFYLLLLRGMNAHLKPSYIFVASTFVVHLAVFMNRSFGLLGKITSPEQLFLRKLVISAVFLFTPLIAFTGGVNAETYFVTATLVPIALIFGPTIFDQFKSLVFSNPKIAVALSAVFTGSILISTATNYFYWRILSSQASSGLVFLITYFDVFMFGSAILVSVFICFLAYRSQKSFVHLTIVLTVVLASTNFGLYISSQFRHDIWNRVYGQQLSELALSQSQISVGEWLKNNSDSDDVVATNHYCQQTVNAGELPPLHPEDCRQRGLNAWIGAISQRRMLVEAPLVSIYGPGARFTEQSADIYNMPLEFGQNPTYFLQSRLSALGVDWFVVEKSLTRFSSWSKFGNLMYETHDYAVLRF